jgi:hypothetical protein
MNSPGHPIEATKSYCFVSQHLNQTRHQRPQGNLKPLQMALYQFQHRIDSPFWVKAYRKGP